MGIGGTAAVRLRKDYAKLARDPVPFVTAAPKASNILEWHYIVRGPPDSPYAGGFYHGKLVFPANYPFQPPSIYMLTPNGRFKTNTRLCLSMSDFHPDTWNPAWSVSTIITGLLSFMLEESPTHGSVTASTFERRMLARKSRREILRDSVVGNLFPEIVAEVQRIVEAEEAMSASNGTTQDSNSSPIPPDSGGRFPLVNLFLLVAVAAMAYTVQYIVNAE